MVAKPVRWALAGLLACPSLALALGLGDVHLHSTLDAPLRATIDLVGATPDELQSLKPQIAARGLFVQNGLNWSPFLADVKVTVVHGPNGHDVLELRSTKPVTQPFLTMLIELDWDRGRVVREYDLLFDPPVYTPQQTAAAPSIAAPVSGGSTREGAVERSHAQAATAPAASGASSAAAPAAAASAATAAAGGSYRVRRGDTLSGIAERLAGGSVERVRRWMVAAYQRNPQAFDRNMNWLRAGTVLRVPSAAALDAVSPSAARVEIHRQYVAWRGELAHQPSAAGQSGRLRLVAPGTGTAKGGAAIAAEASAAGSSVQALRGQVQSLQSQLAASRRLLDLRNQQLQQLQAQLAAREGEHAAAGAPSAASPSAATRSAASEAAAAQQAAPAPQSAAAQAPGAQQPAARSPQAAAAAASASAAHHPAHRVVRRPAAGASHARSAASGSWLGLLQQFWWVIALAVVALLGYLGLRSARSRRKAGFDDSLGKLAEAGAARTTIREPTLTEPRPAARGDEGDILVEETGTHEHPRIEGAAGPAVARHVASDEGVSGEAAINLDQGDPLAEADFHMAYGLYDQAADLVRIAIEREPERRDLRLKLLEVYFVWGNKDEFLATARELGAGRMQAAPGEWEKILIMGKQLAPEDPLFAGGAAVSGAAAGGVDLDLEGGQHRVDFDVADGASEPQSIDLDIGTAIGERDPVAEAAAQQATDKNLALDDSLVLPEDATVERESPTATQRMLSADSGIGATREMTGTTREMTTTLDQGSWDGELNPEGATVEQPTLSSEVHPSLRQKVEMALKAGAAGHEQEHTTELALDDLGLDLTALEDGPSAEGPSGAETGHAADGHAGMPQGAPGDAHGGSEEREAPRHAARANGAEPLVSSETPTLVAGLDEHSRALMARAAERQSSEEGELKVTETGTWHFDDTVLAQDGGTEHAAAHGKASGVGDLADTSRLVALQPGSDVDFEIGDVPAAKSADGHGGVDLDVGAATVPDAAFAATQRLQADELPMPDLDPVTMSEVGTKLDLARAYMDMGDPEGARNILDEVLTEGSSTQKQEAERLIASLP